MKRPLRQPYPLGFRVEVEVAIAHALPDDVFAWVPGAVVRSGCTWAAVKLDAPVDGPDGRFYEVTVWSTDHIRRAGPAGGG